MHKGTLQHTIVNSFFFGLILVLNFTQAQNLKSISVTNNRVVSLWDGNRSYSLNRPLISFEVNEQQHTSDLPTPFHIEFKLQTSLHSGVVGTILFKNITKDTLMLSNVLPFGKKNNEVYVTGLGAHRLSRTHLFLTGKKPVNVIVPDNAWELGYTGLNVIDQIKMYGFVRRDVSTLVNATRRRFETIVAPGGSVVYNFYADVYQGEWQEGLREVFQRRYLYDVKDFDDSLYKRSDLSWIRNAYVMHLMMAWDKDFYDGNSGNFNLAHFIDRGKVLYGGDDVVCIWPTWPTLGVDQRNQFDLYRDLPGGLQGLRSLAEESRKQGAKFFIAYNPWDESTRSEGHLTGLADLIEGTSADGVVLDTKGESSHELQDAADKVKSGVIMYSEGMAVPKDMPGIISGRVHNALYYPPLLNLNKFIRPDFAIFRVAEVYKEPILREYAVAFFNGYGTEINQFAPGHPEWEEAQYKFLGKTTRILRENTSLFTSDYTPLIPTLRDSVWVNSWHSKDKSVYTIFSVKSEGLNGPLFEMNVAESRWIDLWKHEEVLVDEIGAKSYVVVNLDGFDARDLGTNNEGSVSCIAKFTPQLDVIITGDLLKGSCSTGSTIKIWKGNPAYDKVPVLVQASGNQFELSLGKAIGRYEGKLVIQAFRNHELVDERVVYLKPGTPRLVSETDKTPRMSKLPADMVLIPTGKLTFRFTQGDEFIPYPKVHEGETVSMSPYAMDKYPVTNRAFKRFLDSSNYIPTDTVNFLKHWLKGEIPQGQENFPVTFISYEDAKAYSSWAGKRLPTELEWQYAAQTSAGNEWPWKQSKPVTREETYVTETLTVKNLKGIDPQYSNLGDGELYTVGKYRKGVNPFGLYDLVGSVWQLTNDLYENGSYRYIMMKGGSYFKPASSWWYVQGGPRELHYRQFLLRISQGFERNSTVGFRCVADIK